MILNLAYLIGSDDWVIQWTLFNGSTSDQQVCFATEIVSIRRKRNSQCSNCFHAVAVVLYCLSSLFKMYTLNARLMQNGKTKCVNRHIQETNDTYNAPKRAGTAGGKRERES